MRVIGIDPGTAIMGWGVVERLRGDELRLVGCGVVTTPAGMAPPQRLAQLYDELRQLLTQYRPDEAAVEELFFRQGFINAVPVGQARGVALLALVQAGLPIHEYKPLYVKQTITGYGSADKRQVQEMVRMTLGLPAVIKPDDAADAVAIAMCHAYVRRMMV